MNKRSNTKTEIPFNSNSIRLSFGQWIFVGAFCIAFILLIPSLWQKYEKFTPDIDYRQPYKLSRDYWLYERYTKYACAEHETLIIGDSVVWGHYVSKDKTLSHHLNELTNSNNFANLGADGMHPAALEGLLRYYGKDIKNKNVILHLNLLWMSSPLHDLQTEKEFNFNHPKLVAQFNPKIPCYKASFPKRLSIVLKRFMTFASWSSHLNIKYFQNMDMPSWTIENPYKNPIKAIDFNLHIEDYYDNTELTERQTTEVSFQWVEAKTSLQWELFKRTIQLLQERDNKIFILVGPFNEHKLDEESVVNYVKLKSEVELWLQQNNIDHFAPIALPSEFYNDVSHPTAKGYKKLAEEILECESFNDYFFENTP